MRQLSGVFNYAPLLTDWPLMRTDVKRGKLGGTRALSAKQHVPCHGPRAMDVGVGVDVLQAPVAVINWRQAGNSNEALLRFFLMAKLDAPMCGRQS